MKSNIATSIMPLVFLSRHCLAIHHMLLCCTSLSCSMDCKLCQCMPALSICTWVGLNLFMCRPARYQT